MNEEQVPEQMLGLWRLSWETYLKTVKATGEQGERMLDLMLQQSETFQEESRRLIKQWVDNYKKINQSYFDAVEQNVEKMETTLERKEKKT